MCTTAAAVDPAAYRLFCLLLWQLHSHLLSIRLCLFCVKDEAITYLCDNHPLANIMIIFHACHWRCACTSLPAAGMFDVQQQPAAEGELEGVTVSTKQGAALDIDQQLAALAEQ